MLNKINQIINPLDLDYIVVNHMELDHAGSMAELKTLTNTDIHYRTGKKYS